MEVPKPNSKTAATQTSCRKSRYRDPSHYESRRQKQKSVCLSVEKNDQLQAFEQKSTLSRRNLTKPTSNNRFLWYREVRRCPSDDVYVSTRRPHLHRLLTIPTPL